MRKFTVGNMVELPQEIKFDFLSRFVLMFPKIWRFIMNKFKTGETVKLPSEMYPNVPGTVISYNEKKEQYLVRFNGVQQLYFSEDQLKLWDK